MRVFASGSLGRLVTDQRYREGAQAAFYGVQPALIPVWNEVQRTGAHYYYMDNAYFGHRHYYRVTKDALQCTGRGEPDWARYDRLGIKFAPWNRSGGHILICPHTEYFHDLMLGESRADWLRRVQKTLRRHTGRPLVVRSKPKHPNKSPISLVLREAWAVVTPQSNAAVDALRAGVPVFTTGQSAANPMACRDLTQIETPFYPDNREEWAAVLSAHQWTLPEIQDGKCWRALQAYGGEPH